MHSERSSNKRKDLSKYLDDSGKEKSKKKHEDKKLKERNPKRDNNSMYLNDDEDLYRIRDTPENETQTSDEGSKNEAFDDAPVVVPDATNDLISTEHHLSTDVDRKHEINRRYRRRYDSSSSSSSYDSNPRNRKSSSRDKTHRYDSDSDTTGRLNRSGGNNSDARNSSTDVAAYRVHDKDSAGHRGNEKKGTDAVRRERRERYDTSSSDDDSHNGGTRHVPGIQTGSEFSRKEAKIQEQKQSDALRTVEKYGIGETVYRDRHSGRQLEGPPERQQKSSTVLDEKEQYLLQTSSLQREKEEERRNEFQKIQQSTFARYEDDTEIQDYRKNIIHKDDPMAAYAVSKQQKTGDHPNGKPSRPIYKGPPPKPNRFGLRPGHRWDANDRGNGFEDRILAMRYNAQHQQEQAYRYSSADM